MNPKANHGLFGAIVQTLSEDSTDAIPDKRDQMMDEVRHNLKMYYHHLNIHKSMEALGDHNSAAHHLEKSTDRHNRASSLHAEIHSAYGMHGPSFANLKAFARSEVGYKD